MATPVDTHEEIDQWLWRQSISVHGNLVKEHGGGSLAWDSEGKMNFQRMGYRRFCGRMSP